jgi:7,8-dihydropterin-6-yl-methyl-4-(beta-D-ribofuranosyl)aminobenzene 5'-phosphate synthase
VQKISDTEKIHAIIGGFHLVNAKPELIQRTVAYIKSLKPDFIVPTHSTGFEAIIAIRSEMPDQFILSTAGTKYAFQG